jgi:hypothetical protein
MLFRLVFAKCVRAGKSPWGNPGVDASGNRSLSHFHPRRVYGGVAGSNSQLSVSRHNPLHRIDSDGVVFPQAFTGQNGHFAGPFA